MNETLYGTLKIEILLDIPGRADHLKPLSRVIKRTLITEHNLTRNDAVLFFDQFKQANADTLETRNLHACWVPMPDWL